MNAVEVIYSIHITDTKRNIYTSGVPLYKVDAIDKIIILNNTLFKTSYVTLFNDVYFSRVLYRLWYILPDREFWLPARIIGNSSIYGIFGSWMDIYMFTHAVLELDNIKGLIEDVANGKEIDCQPLKVLSGSGRFCIKATAGPDYTEISQDERALIRTVTNNSTVIPGEVLDVHLKLADLINYEIIRPILTVRVAKL